MKQIKINVYRAEELTPDNFHKAKCKFLKNYPHDDSEVREVLKVVMHKFCLDSLEWDVNSQDFKFSFDLKHLRFSGTRLKNWVVSNLGEIVDMEQANHPFLYTRFLSAFVSFLKDSDSRDMEDLIMTGLNRLFAAYRDEVKGYNSDSSFIAVSEESQWFYFKNGDLCHTVKHGVIEVIEEIDLTPEAPALQLNETWLSRKYLDGKAEINTALPFVSFGEYFAQGDEADQAIKEIYSIWSIQDVTQEEALLQWASIYGLDMPE
jgi:hypothetical protein